MGKTNPLNDADLADFLARSVKREASENSWTVPVGSIDKSTWDLSAKNPNKFHAVENQTPRQILDEIDRLEVESADVIAKLRSLV